MFGGANPEDPYYKRFYTTVHSALVEVFFFFGKFLSINCGNSPRFSYCVRGNNTYLDIYWVSDRPATNRQAKGKPDSYPSVE